jgi:hypothetical protein
MFDPIQWLDDCEQALADADYLAVRLARAGSSGSDLTALRMRIAALRAEFERARGEFGIAARRQVHPDWISRPDTPWCPPASTEPEEN